MHLYGESVSIQLHETYIIKKEVEYCLDVSTNWITRYFFFFSSFRGGVQRMFHRPVFNFACLAMILAHAILDTKASKISFI